MKSLAINSGNPSERVKELIYNRTDDRETGCKPAGCKNGDKNHKKVHHSRFIAGVADMKWADHIPLSGCGQRLNPPAQSNPLLDVIGQASPHGFHEDFQTATQSKLTQPNLSFDPGIRTLGHPSALSVDGFGLGGPHLLHKSCDRRMLDSPRNRAPLNGILRTALGFNRASGAVLRICPIPMMNDPDTILLTIVTQEMAGGTAIKILLGIIYKSLRVKSLLDTAASQLTAGLRGMFIERTNEIDLLVRHRQNVLATCKPSVCNHLLRDLPYILLN